MFEFSNIISDLKKINVNVFLKPGDYFPGFFILNIILNNQST